MAKGKLKAEEMYKEKLGLCGYATKKETIELMRKFAKQETKWWASLCNKWEVAYKGLLSDTDI